MECAYYFASLDGISRKPKTTASKTKGTANLWRNGTQFKRLQIHKDPSCFCGGTQATVRFADDFVLANGRYAVKVCNPSLDQDCVMEHGWNLVGDLVRSNDPSGT